MNKQTSELKKKLPKVRSYVRPTKVHVPKNKKRSKYPHKVIEEQTNSDWEN